MCGGDPSKHRPACESRARKFSEPILVFESLTSPGDVSMPATNTEPCPPGYRPRLIDNLQEADRFINQYNRHESGKLSDDRAREREYWNEVTRARRDSIRARIGSSPRARALFEEIQRYVDTRRERRYRGNPDAQAHFQALAFDSGNRPSHASAETGWRERKG